MRISMKVNHPRRILVGAAVGVLGALAIVGAGVPTTDATNSGNVIAVAALIGAALAALAPAAALGWATGAAALLGLLLFTSPVLSAPFRNWVRSDTISTQPLDAVVVLSSGITGEGLLDPVALERTVAGVQLMQRTHAPLLLTTRVTTTFAVAVTSDDDQRAIAAMGLDTARWRTVGLVHTTHDEALATRRVLSGTANPVVAVVTSPLHARRACATFEAAGFRVVCAPSPGRAYTVRDLRYPRERFRALMDYLYERAGWIEYRWRGWVRA